MNTTSTITSVFWFFTIVALIPLVLWLLKRSGAMGHIQTTAGLRAVAVLPISAHQRIMTIEVEHGSQRQFLVLGVTAQSISVLREIPAPEQKTVPSAPPPVPFAHLLIRALRPGKPEPASPVVGGFNAP